MAERAPFSDPLPPEIMADIFLRLARAHVYAWRNELGERVGTPHTAYGWTPYTHVCRRWRLIALDCPALWCHIFVWREAPLEAVQTLISRSAQMPLTVIIDDIDGIDGVSCIEAVLDELHRIQELCVAEEVADDREEIKALCARFADREASLLRRLTVGRTFLWGIEGQDGPKTPMLADLTRWWVSLPTTTTLFRTPSITRLALFGWTWQAPVRALLDVFAGLPALRHLSLACHVWNGSQWQDEYASDLPVVRLRHLETFDISTGTCEKPWSTLFRRLAFPLWTTRITYKASVDPDFPSTENFSCLGELLYRLGRLMTQQSSPPFEALFVDCGNGGMHRHHLMNTSVSSRLGMTVFCGLSLYEQTSFSLLYGLEPADTVRRRITALDTLTLTASVRMLYHSELPDRALQPPTTETRQRRTSFLPVEWRTMCGRMNQVEVLCLSGMPFIQDVLHHFDPADPVHSDPTLPQFTTDARPVLFPRLSALVLLRYPRFADAKKEWKEMQGLLLSRMSSGYPVDTLILLSGFIKPDLNVGVPVPAHIVNDLRRAGVKEAVVCSDPYDGTLTRVLGERCSKEFLAELGRTEAPSERTLVCH